MSHVCKILSSSENGTEVVSSVTGKILSADVLLIDIVIDGEIVNKWTENKAAKLMGIFDE
jgi:hypothetical protein